MAFVTMVVWGGIDNGVGVDSVSDSSVEVLALGVNSVEDGAYRPGGANHGLIANEPDVDHAYVCALSKGCCAFCSSIMVCLVCGSMASQFARFRITRSHSSCLAWNCAGSAGLVDHGVMPSA